MRPHLPVLGPVPVPVLKRGVTFVVFELLLPAFELFVWEILQVRNYRMGTSRPPIESPQLALHIELFTCFHPTTP
jgi:hypothetical protein